MKRQPMEGFIEIGIGPDGKQGFWIDPSLVRNVRTNRVGLNLSPRSPIYVDDAGVNVRAGDGLEVTTGSPVAVRAAPTPIPQELSALRVKIATAQQALAGKASQADVDALSSGKADNVLAEKGTPGLVQMAEDTGDVGTGSLVLLSDVISAVTEIRSKFNNLMAAKRDAGQVG